MQIPLTSAYAGRARYFSLSDRYYAGVDEMLWLWGAESLLAMVSATSEK